VTRRLLAAAVTVLVLAVAGCSTNPQPELRTDAELCRVLTDELPGGSQRTVVDLLTTWPTVPAGRGDPAIDVDGDANRIAAAVRMVAGVTAARIGTDRRVYADVPTVARRTAVATRIRAIAGVTDVRDTNAGASALYAAYGLAARSSQQSWTATLKTLNDAGKGKTKTALATLLDAHLDLMLRLVKAPVTDLVGGGGAVFSTDRWKDVVAASETVDRFTDRTCGQRA
jgi:hypothetical protein